MILIERTLIKLAGYVSDGTCNRYSFLFPLSRYKIILYIYQLNRFYGTNHKTFPPYAFENQIYSRPIDVQSWKSVFHTKLIFQTIKEREIHRYISTLKYLAIWLFSTTCYLITGSQVKSYARTKIIWRIGTSINRIYNFNTAAIYFLNLFKNYYFFEWNKLLNTFGRSRWFPVF